VQQYLGSVGRSDTFSPGSTPRCSATAPSCTSRRVRADGAQTYFPSTGGLAVQRTLIIADEGSYVSYLEGARRRARDEPAHAAWSSWSRSRRDDQVIDGANWLRRQGRQRRSTTSYEVWKVRGRQFQDSWTQRDRQRDHLKYPTVSPRGHSTGNSIVWQFEQPPASRTGHEDDPHRPQHEIEHRQQGSRPGRGQNSYAPGEGASEGGGARNYTQCDSMLRQRVGAHTSLIEVRPTIGQVEHEPRRAESARQDLLLKQRGLSAEAGGEHDRERFCRKC